MSTIPVRVLDLSGPLGAGPAYFVLRVYDENDYRRYTWVEGGGGEAEFRVPWRAVPMFEAFMGARAQLFTSAAVDLAQVSSGTPIIPAFPGYFFAPADNAALRVYNVSGAGALTHAPTIRLGNNAGHDNLGTATLRSDAFAAGTDWVMRPALGTNALKASVFDMATSPIVLDVIDPATGTGGFAWTVMFILSGTWMVADHGSYVPALLDLTPAG